MSASASLGPAAIIWHGARMPKRRRKSGRIDAPPDVAEPQAEPARPAPKPPVPWWKDPLKLSALAMVILVVIDLGAGSHLPPKIVSYLDPLILLLGVLSIVLSIMRRWENR
ncbi:MAG: hypothetical protein ACREED_09920 [Stellaceae bacterium]